MKLYYSPAHARSSPHIALHESGLPFEAVKAPTKTHKLDDGTDYYTINIRWATCRCSNSTTAPGWPRGRRSLQYIADQVPGKKLAPAWGTLARYRLIGWLNFISTELHKGVFSALFQSGHAGRVQDGAEGASGRAAGLGQRPARRQDLADRRRLHGRRRLPLRRHQLGQADEHRSRAVPHLVAWRERVAARPRCRRR